MNARLWGMSLCLGLFLAAQPTLRAADDEEYNNGQDITKPLTRFDVRYMFQNAPGHDNDSEHILTLRMDRPFELNERWKIGTRVDLPLMLTDRISRDNLDGDWQFGLSDALVQGLIINTPSERFAWAFGPQIVFPTATQEEMGTGTWRVVPTFGARWTTDEILKGSWIALAARWDRSFAHSRSNYTTVNEMQFAPIVNIPLPNHWFINLWPSTDIRYNLGDKRRGDKGRWFVPANVMVGKMLRKNVVASLEVGVPIIKDYQVYDFKGEFRLGFFF